MPRQLWLLVVARAINRLGAFSLPFLTVLITTAHGASPATAGLVTAAFGLATIPSRLAGGWLADRLGRRRTIVLGLAGCALAQAGIAGSPNLPVVAGCAILLGLVFELYEPPSQAIVADVTGAESGQRARAYSLLNAALAVAGMGAGLLAAGLGRWDLRWLFVADAVTCLACALLVHLALPDDRPARRADRGLGEAKAGASPWRDRMLAGLLVTGTLFALVYLQVVICLPLALTDRGLLAADAGVLLTTSAVTIVAGQPLLRLRRLSTLSTPVALAIGYGLMAAGLAGYATARSLWTFVIWTVCWSIGELALVGRIYAAVADLAPAGATGRYLAAYGTSWGIAGIAAPVAGTQLLQHAGAAWFWTSLAMACVVLAIVQPLVVRTVTGSTSLRARSGDGG